MKRFLIVTACALAALPAFAQSVPERTGVNSALGISPSTQDFVSQAAISDMFELESSKLAEQKADESSKKFASKMITDHTGTSNELKGLVQSGQVKATLPTTPDDAHKSKLDKLRGLSGNDFDKQYDDDQVNAHEDAVSLFERYSNGGENASLKAFATKHLPHLKEHLEMAKKLK